jgi:glycosidase
MPGDITLLYSVSRIGALDFYHVILIANLVFSFVIVTKLRQITDAQNWPAGKVTTASIRIYCRRRFRRRVNCQAFGNFWRLDVFDSNKSANRCSLISIWPRYPTIYEINTRAWLFDLGEKTGHSVDLRSVPSSEWDGIAAYGFDAVWLMGVWQRSPSSIAISNRNNSLLDEFKRALPDFQPRDNIGSAYSVRGYSVDEALGGPEGLSIARHELAERGIRLILDFVPNHVALDHPWVCEHPEYFIDGGPSDANNQPESFVELNGRIFAFGQDPYFPPWRDVLQLNAFDPRLRQAAIETIVNIASQCDGVRCDMAMLLLNSIFEQTWGSRAGLKPATEYWADLIAAIKSAPREFLFIAEAYWDREWELQQQGFDFCYDKRFYDRLAHGNAESVRAHLSAPVDYQSKLLHFIENHDEQRAAAAFPLHKQRPAAVAMATVAGARLFYEGQFEGRKVRVPVFLRRRAAEPADQTLEHFYKQLLHVTKTSVFREGEWSLCHCIGWPDNSTYQNLLAWSWSKDSDRYLVVINSSDSPAQGRVQVPWAEIQRKTWCLLDLFSGDTYERRADEMRDPGLYVGLRPWDYHFFRLIS